MLEDLFGDGLVLEDARPLAWAPGPLTQGVALAQQNAENLQLLLAEASIEEARAQEALQDESPALLHELQRIEYKLNMLLRLTAEIARHANPLPPLRPLWLSAQAIEWCEAAAAPTGTTGLLQLHINTALPQPLMLSCRVYGEREVEGQRRIQLRFAGISAPVTDALEKLIFRRHRRLIAGSRGLPVTGN